jgi:hypothetical protein
MLEELAKVANAMDAVALARQSEGFPDYRQLLAIDTEATTAGATYPLAAASDAHRRMEAGGLFGKVALADFHE